MSPLLEVEGLSVQYRRRGAAIRALDDVSFDVAAGETVGLVGESGSGKSTAGRAILGLTPISAGTIRFDGRDVTDLPFAARRELYRDMQMVFQDPYSSLNPSRTIGQTLAEPLRAFGMRDRGQLRARVCEMLERVDLPPQAMSRHPREFSGGQRQRIAIARALMLEPKLVVCDEAVSALDLSIQAQVLNLLRELQGDSGLSYLFISHDLEVVRHLCDRVVVLYRGRVMESGGGARVSSDPSHPYTHALQQAAPVPDPRVQRSRHRDRTAGPAASRETAPGPDGCPFAPRCPHARARCGSERPRPRVVYDGGVVACHRYPVWREELPRRGTLEETDGGAGGDARPGGSRGGGERDA